MGTNFEVLDRVLSHKHQKETEGSRRLGSIQFSSELAPYRAGRSADA
jgi:hypothetical protein